MGTWNRKIFGNDTACDVKDTYTKYLYNQYSDEDAYNMTYHEYCELIGSDEEPIFWYAIAAIQWEVGRLMPSVKEKALFWIEAKGGMELWNDTIQLRKKWEKTLLDLKKTLTSEMPKKKSFRKEVFETNLWNIGDIYAYQFHKEISKDKGLHGKYILLHKIAESNSFNDTIIPRIQVYNKIFDKLPTVAEIDKLKVLPFDNAITYSAIPAESRLPITLNIVMLRNKKRDYMEKYYTYIGNIEDPYSYPIANFYSSLFPWNYLEECIDEYLPSWNEYDYSVNNGEISVFKN